MAEDLVTRLRQALPALLAPLPVDLAYLYGSVVTGYATPFSDVDIGVVLATLPAPRERLDLLLGLEAWLAENCQIPNADVRILNDAPLIFRGKVVTDGVLLYARDEEVRVAFEVETRMRYFDYRPIHDQLQAAFFADLRERGV